MATPPERLINTRGQKGTAKYKCPACREIWKVKNSRGWPKTCERCGKTWIPPYDFIPNQTIKRMFGEFHCSCGNTWSSGYAWIEWDKEAKKWVENWQRCRRCIREVYPGTLQPLKYTSGNASQKPHDSTNCEMCQKHGDCRNLRTSEVDEEEWDDSASVRSEASSISDLSSKLKGLHMK